MDEDEMLKRMTKLLEQGCTMLASHHSCGAPLFRCKGEIICPACSLEEGMTSAAGVGARVAQGSPALEGVSGMEALAEGAAPAASQEAKICEAEMGGTEAGEAGETEVSDRDALISAKAVLRRTLLRRLKDLTEGVESEGDLDKLHRQLACIEGIVNILKALER